MILDKKTHIEIENTDGDLFFIRKDEIGKVQWVKDN